jgi:hypothetical protein
MTTNWAFVDSLSLNYFTGVRGQPDNDDCTQENRPYNCDHHKRDVARAPGDTISQRKRGEQGSKALSRKPAARARAALRLLIFSIDGAPLKMSVEGKRVCVSLVLLTNASRMEMEELQNL